MDAAIFEPTPDPDPSTIRERVEVIIRKDNMIALIRSHDERNAPHWRGLPGGGVDGDTHENACTNEALEEIGIRIKDIKYTGVSYLEEAVSAKGNRRSIYSRSRTTWYYADFNYMDISRLGADNDIRRFDWVTLEEARKLLEYSNHARKDAQLLAIYGMEVAIERAEM
jgi:8-oxo-dGTP pyrophosphatase MutT (NUDIX family)